MAYKDSKGLAYIITFIHFNLVGLDIWNIDWLTSYKLESMENNKITTKRARVQGKWTNLPKKGLEAKEKGIIYTKKG